MNDGHWFFCYGNRKNFENGVSFEDLPVKCQILLDTGQLFKGHAKFNRVYQARHQAQLNDCILRHVSAHGLDSLIAPTLL